MVKAINRLLLEINQHVYEVKLKLNRETKLLIMLFWDALFQRILATAALKLMV